MPLLPEPEVPDGPTPALSAEHAAHVVDVIETIRRSADEQRGLRLETRFPLADAPAWAEEPPLRS